MRGDLLRDPHPFDRERQAIELVVDHLWMAEGEAGTHCRAGAKRLKRLVCLQHRLIVLHLQGGQPFDRDLEMRADEHELLKGW